jgi:hypothetical protein
MPGDGATARTLSDALDVDIVQIRRVLFSLVTTKRAKRLMGAARPVTVPRSGARGPAAVGVWCATRKGRSSVAGYLDAAR